MTERTHLSIREVLDLLVAEFPDVTISKIRFLESRGLIHPERTPSGYRKFYDADVERLRWILQQQREHFLPLKVIKGRLEAASGASGGRDPIEPSLFDGDYADLPFELTRLVGVAARQGAETAEPSGLRLVPGASGRLVAARAAISGDVAVRAGHNAVAGLVVADAREAIGPSTSPAEDPTTGLSPEPRRPQAPVAAGAARQLPDCGEPAGSASGRTAPRLGPAALSSPLPAPAAAAEPARSHADGPPPAEGPEAAPPAAAGSPAAADSEPSAGAPPAAADSEPSAGAPAAATGRSGQGVRRGTGRQRKAPAVPAATKAPAVPGLGSLASGMSLSAEELAGAAGVGAEVVAELEEYGLLTGRVIAGVRCYDEEALVVTRLAARFRAYGIESRHLRTFKHAAEREAGLFSQVVMPLLRQRNPAARERANASLAELADLGIAIQAALVRAELRDLTGG